MTDQWKQFQLIYPKEVAKIFGRSVRWVYDHWKELGGTNEFGRLAFFKEIIIDRLQKAKQESEAMVLRIQGKKGAPQAVRIFHQERSTSSGSRRKADPKTTEDKYNVFAGR